MPLYEYQCPKCEKVHEVMQKFSDPLLTECPDCSGPITKLVSLSSFSLKGSGWYTTDYKSKASKAPSEKKEGEGSIDTPKPPTEPLKAAAPTATLPPTGASNKTD